MKVFRLIAVVLILVFPSFSEASEYSPGGGAGGTGPPGPAGPSRTLLIGSSDFKLSGITGTTIYMGATVSSDVADAEIAITRSVTVNTAIVNLGNAPTGTKKWTVTLLKNGSVITGCNANCVVEITGSSTSGTMSNINRGFNALDRLSMKVVPTGSPESSIINFSAEAELN